MTGPYIHISDGVVRADAALTHCVNHPDQTAENSQGGFGLAGGGFGPYNVCGICDRIFNKQDIPDDEV